MGKNFRNFTLGLNVVATIACAAGVASNLAVNDYVAATLMAVLGLLNGLFAYLSVKLRIKGE